MAEMNVPAAAIAELERLEAVRRIWERDHSVWKPEPTEISNRLGWLNVVAEMRSQVNDLQAFADEVRDDGYQHIVVLGMGGSSLGILALERHFGSKVGWPKLSVLDTTVPDTIEEVTDAIDISKTLFIVASKSGTTIETSVLYRYFRSLTEQHSGAENAGRHFVAICDDGTPLEALAAEQGFRRVFTNPSDIGGRYSVQSLFGLVPAALIGIDIGALLDRVEAMSGACYLGAPVKENPGALLGAAISGFAAEGRDKLTVVTSESLHGFALWVEQLLAESTGKEGRGITPVTGEPHMAPGLLGEDRLFVYARLDSDNTAETDAYVRRVKAAGIPAIELNLIDKYAIGAEFFRWEFATAVIGCLLDINPFDQPDVQSAKDNTSRLIANYQQNAIAPTLDSFGSLADLLAHATAGGYLAITAYARPTPQIEEAISVLRGRVTRFSGIATTFGYGPRYLHSTGQLHKGGPGSGIFLQLTQIGNTDVRIPGENFTFGVLAAAQAKGDLDALGSQGRPVARINLGVDAVQTVLELAKSIH